MAKQRMWKVEFMTDDRKHESLELSGSKNKLLERLYKLKMLQKCTLINIFEADNVSYYGRCIEEKYKEFKGKGLNVDTQIGKTGYTVFSDFKSIYAKANCQWFVYFSTYGKEQVMGICSERVKNNLLSQMMDEMDYKKYDNILVRAINTEEYAQMCKEEVALFRDRANRLGDDLTKISDGVFNRQVKK